MYSAFNPHNVSLQFWDTQVAKLTNLEVTDFKLNHKTCLQTLGGKGAGRIRIQWGKLLSGRVFYKTLSGRRISSASQSTKPATQQLS